MSHHLVDDQAHGHPKFRLAGLEATGLWSMAGSWARNHNTGGFVPRWFVDTWPRGKALAGRLVTARLWEPAEDPTHGAGWRFHDYGDMPYLTPEQERDRLERNRRRQALFRERKAKKRADDGEMM